MKRARARARPRPVPPRKRRGKSAPPRPAESARRELDVATEAVRAAAAALTRVTDDIAAEALEGERARLAAELASEQILRDLAKLERAFAAADDGSLPADLEVLRKLPEAVLAWARERFGVMPHLTVGQELEVPADRLSGFILEGTLPPGGGLVRLRVAAPGWKRGAKVLVPPRALLV